MPMFTKDSTERTDARAMPAEGALSIVAAGMTVVGNIDSNGVVKIEGRVEGTVRSARQVLVGRQGEIRGDVLTREAVIGGRVHGKITATERTEIQATASVEGDIHTKTILVQEGGRLNGSLHMEESVAPASAKMEPRPAAVAVVR